MFGYGTHGSDFRDLHKDKVLYNDVDREYHAAADVTHEPDELPFGSGVPPPKERTARSDAVVAAGTPVAAVAAAATPVAEKKDEDAAAAAKAKRLQLAAMALGADEADLVVRRGVCVCMCVRGCQRLCACGCEGVDP